MSGFRASSIRIAPDNDRVVYMPSGSFDLLIASISGTPEDAIAFSMRDVDGDESATAGVIGWSEAVPSELLFYRVVNGSRAGRSSLGVSTRVERETSRSELRALDPSTLRSRVVRSFAGSQRLDLWGTRIFGFGATADRSWTWLPIWVTEPDDGREILSLVDVRSGAKVELTDSPCPNWGFSAGGDRFLFAMCDGVGLEESARVQLLELDLRTGREEVLVVLDGFLVNSSVRALLISPQGDRIALFGRQGYARSYGIFIVEPGGETRPIEVRGFPIRWLNDREILILGPFGPTRLQRVDVETGVGRTIFP